MGVSKVRLHNQIKAGKEESSFIYFEVWIHRYIQTGSYTNHTHTIRICVSGQYLINEFQLFQYSTPPQSVREHAWISNKWTPPFCQLIIDISSDKEWKTDRTTTLYSTVLLASFLRRFNFSVFSCFLICTSSGEVRNFCWCLCFLKENW